MASDKMRKVIINGLEPLFERAEREGLWFFAIYQKMWLSPDELRAHHKRGEFMWGSVNWTLRDPKERLAELIRAIQSAEMARNEFAERMKRDTAAKV